MSAITVHRRDITVTEERDYEMGFADVATTEANATRTSWTAVLDGRLSTGESISITRYGATFQEATNALAEKIAELGWAVV